jgi:hypothetical protein
MLLLVLTHDVGDHGIRNLLPTVSTDGQGVSQLARSKQFKGQMREL